MNVDFDQLSKAVMDHITAQNRGKATRNAYRRSYIIDRYYPNHKSVLSFHGYEPAVLLTISR